MIAELPGRLFTCRLQRWAPDFFPRFCARKGEAKKSVKKNKREKSESTERKRKKREYAFFPPVVAHHWKPGSRAQTTRKGKARVLSKMYVK
jgi:hypothetical protein